VAVSDTPGTVTFYDAVDQSGFSGLRRPVVGDPDNPGSGSTIRSYDVDCETLDRLFVTGDGTAPVDPVPVDLIKIDVEGAELPALRGGEQLLATYRPDIVFECAEDSGLEAFGYTRADLHDFFTDADYHVWLVRDHVFGRGPMGRDEFVRAGTYPFPGFNYVARPAGTEATRIM
jgi:FkbM family methyltransferase